MPLLLVTAVATCARHHAPATAGSPPVLLRSLRTPVADAYFTHTVWRGYRRLYVATSGCTSFIPQVTHRCRLPLPHCSAVACYARSPLKFSRALRSGAGLTVLRSRLPYLFGSYRVRSACRATSRAHACRTLPARHIPAAGWLRTTYLRCRLPAVTAVRCHASCHGSRLTPRLPLLRTDCAFCAVFCHCA